MGYYDDALICKKGHIINSQVREKPYNNDEFCKLCGAATVSKCISCNSPIKGYFHGSVSCYDDVELSFPMDDTPPAFCYKCGKPYPWTEEKVMALKELFKMSELEAEDLREFDNNIKDIVSDTPRTKVAALKIKQIGGKIGKELWDVAKPILTTLATAAAKQTLGIP